jgi:RND superfamily putative drug exporter
VLARLAALVSGRRSKLVALGVWLVALALLAPLAGRFESVQRNEASSFLPQSAESVAVLEEAKRFPSGETVPAVVVVRAQGGLGAGDRERVASVRSEIADASVPGTREPLPPTYSEDGKAAVIVVPVEATGDEDVLIGAVEEVRAIARAAAGAGLEVRVTGPAGFAADATKVFEGVNTTLLYATASLVLVLLIVIYRSPVFWILPLVSVLFAELTVRGLGTLMAEAGVLINGQTGGILLVLVFGAGTDYALLLTARYREELRRREDRHEAMRVAVTSAGPAILASAGTVVAALLCLSLADVSSIAGLGPVGAMGVAVAALAMLTVLPAILLVGGRRAFWPFVPRYGDPETAGRGFWRSLGEGIERRPRAVWIATALALVVLASGVVTLDDELTTNDLFRGSVESVEGQRLLEASFPAGVGAPTTVLVRDPTRLDDALAAASSSPDVASVGRVETGAPGARFEVALVEDPFSAASYEAIGRLRADLRATAGDSVLVGGPTAEEADLRAAIARDTRLLIPLVLLVVFAILVLLLRSLVAPLLLMATVVLSFFAALGGALLGFELLADFPGEDPSYPLLAFIFLVALGVDYNIFLMARVREEAQAAPTRSAMLTGLALTGGVITSAGIVLAGTFSVLAVLPLVPLTQTGLTVAFGVLLDALVVRSVLVPALTFEVGEWIWWPSRLSRRGGEMHAEAQSGDAHAVEP